MSHKPLTEKQLEDAKRMYTMGGGTYGSAERVIEHVAAIAFENGLAQSAGKEAVVQYERDDTGRITSSYEPSPEETRVCRDAICREFGNNGTDGYYVRILKAVHAVPAAVNGGAREPMTRFCPHCGSLGPVGDEYRDCCPDGNSARMVPIRFAEVCAETFKLAVGKLIADASQAGGDADLAKLKAAAQAATPGPWFYQEKSDAYTHIVRPEDNPGMIVYQYGQDSRGVQEANARYMAAANPDAVLSLIGRLERAQAALSSPTKAGGDRKDAAQPDMFWNNDDPEQVQGSIHNVVIEAYESGYDIGSMVEVQQAIRLENVKVQITRDETGEIAYEYIDAAIAAKGAGGDA